MTLAPECTFALDGAATLIVLFAIPLAILATALTIFLYRKSVERRCAFRRAIGSLRALSRTKGRQ